MKTEPQEMAARISSASARGRARYSRRTCRRSHAEPQAVGGERQIGRGVVEKARQRRWPRNTPTAASNCQRPPGPSVQDQQAGAIVTKMPTNSTATSMIGPNVNLLAMRSADGVVE